MSSALAFEKYEGLGNDFVVVDLPVTALSSAEVIAICDRHRGIGADGVLFVGSETGELSMRVINADGSRAEMCGNGLRCVAFHFARRGGPSAVGQASLVATEAGPHRVQVLSIAGARAEVYVHMRPASLAPRDVPVLRDMPVVDMPLHVLGRDVRVTAISMGNPHAVLFDDVGDARTTLGPEIQQHPLFPEKANVGFARVLEGAARVTLELHVYERGAGWTQACGTGACAAVVAAVETGRARRGEPVEVRLPGGALEIVAGSPGEPIRMTGPARHVFSGSWPRGT